MNVLQLSRRWEVPPGRRCPSSQGARKPMRPSSCVSARRKKRMLHWEDYDHQIRVPWSPAASLRRYSSGSDGIVDGRVSSMGQPCRLRTTSCCSPHGAQHVGEFSSSLAQPRYTHGEQEMVVRPATSAGILLPLKSTDCTGHRTADHFLPKWAPQNTRSMLQVVQESEKIETKQQQERSRLKQQLTLFGTTSIDRLPFTHYKNELWRTEHDQSKSLIRTMVSSAGSGIRELSTYRREISRMQNAFKQAQETTDMRRLSIMKLNAGDKLLRFHVPRNTRVYHQ